MAEEQPPEQSPQPLDDQSAPEASPDDAPAAPSDSPAVQGDAPPEEPSQKAPPSVPLTPPEDSEAVTSDRGVLKKILEPGEAGVKPSLHARCLIHYIGYLAGSGELFMDTRKDREKEEPVIVVAGRNTAAQETGLCLAAATMCKGERALVYVLDPKYGYGANGSFSFPCVPPACPLVYEVEMLDWEELDERDGDAERVTLLYEERLERAERRRLAGNALFEAGGYKDALAKYALALSYMDEDFMYQLEGHYLDKAEAIKLRIHLNMAAAQLKTGDFNTAIYNCGQVLTLDPNNVKALFRRGKAQLALGRSEEAQQDLDAALKLEPGDKAIISELHALRAVVRKEREAQKSLYRGRLKSAPAAAGEAAAAAGDDEEDEGEGRAGPGPATAAAQGEGSAAAAAARAAGGKKAAAGAGGKAAAGSGSGAAAGKGAPKKAGARAGAKSKPSAGGSAAVWGLLVWLWSLLAWMVGRRAPAPRRAVRK